MDLTGDTRVDAFAARLATYRGDVRDEAIAEFGYRSAAARLDGSRTRSGRVALADFALKFRRAETLARVRVAVPRVKRWPS